MAHQLETFADGTTSFVSARHSAWHLLGTVTDRSQSADEMMTKAKLGGWGVRKIRLVGVDTLADGTEVQVPCDDQMMTVRRNPVTAETDYLGVVGNDYGVVQNEQAAEVLDRLVDQIGGAHYETAGSLRRGKSVFLTLKLPTAMEIAGVDRLNLYLIATCREVVEHVQWSGLSAHGVSTDRLDVHRYLALICVLSGRRR